MVADWANAMSAVAAVFSAVAAIIAVTIAVQSERRSREVFTVEVYLRLKEGFLQIQPNLGDLGMPYEKKPADVRRACEAYWHHAFDEWYIYQALAPGKFVDMWDKFFRAAVLSGYRHPALRTTFEALKKDESQGFATYAQEFITEVEKQARKAADD